MVHLFHDLSQRCSRLTTEQYSTSFNSAIKLLHKDLRTPIYNIYGFVRFADEIVDSFHEHDRALLLTEFKRATYDALERKISINPILDSFQSTVNAYHIDHNLVESFFNSMESDLNRSFYDVYGYQQYIYGSAEVVGLMCLYIFCEGNAESYQQLKPAAQSLGAAFQKVNFLRDIKSDNQQLQRTYFPGTDINNLTAEAKRNIELDIEQDFTNAYKGILQLPVKARFGVYVAYKYYVSLFNKIKRSQPASLFHHRIRIPNYYKAFILMRAGLQSQLNIL